ncbi:uncharacterized protein C8A04DRAFT_11654 [Dichotomopilus funicola]|uniref:Peroxin/Ferlin domain-containing protein n=1 Tax=Dichotomopilus funicola TaxID=1934379 RepID=A0AAN6V3L1_9PEZI|nr:hypothetical protein C8A04DRAFT_11654 [Dichotomopilus funicola]
MPKVRHHRSSRRVPPPKDSDFDHEISLVDRDEEESPIQAPSSGPSTAAPREGLTPDGDGQPTDWIDGEDGLGRGLTEPRDGGQPSVVVQEPTPQVELDDPVAVTRAARDHCKPKTRLKTPESAIDILYENQRGGFLCGIPLFSSMALGNLDPPAWTNFVHRPSPTDIHTAQVPDPSWEWAWPEWRINHDDGVDDDGWEYSFAFSKKFAWHSARWWNSFVRRRAWIRKRVKKDSGYLAQDPHGLTPEYFTIRPSIERDPDRSSSRASRTSRTSSVRDNRLSTGTLNIDGVEPPVIEHADVLLQVLRASRIDRERIEAVDSYLAHAQDDLEGLQYIMHDIMALFVFQASRRVLLSKLTAAHDNRAAAKGKDKDLGLGQLDKQAENLAAAVKHADEEVRRLEYWSDVKGIARQGESKGAVDESQGWDPAWRGVDNSGPSVPPPVPPQDGGATNGYTKNVAEERDGGTEKTA